MLSINTNLSSLIAQTSLKNSTNILNQAIERMSTGYKINHAKDNAANYSIATNMTTRIGAYQVAEDNALQGLDMLMTANESLNLISDKLTRLRALAVQAANGTYGEQSLEAINTEANAHIEEIQRLYSTTEYNGVNLLDQRAMLPENVGLTKDLTPRFNGFIKNPKEYSDTQVSAMKSLSEISETDTISSGQYSISTIEELVQLATMVNNKKVTGGEFVLANDIDLSMYSTGEGWVPIGLTEATAFRGIFNGNGNKITNLYINRPDSELQGLFGFVSSDVKNLAVEDCAVIGGTYTGALAGSSRYNYVIDNCYSTGSVSGIGGTGGLVGYAYQGQIINCFSSCDTTSRANAYTGGLVGLSHLTSSVENCFSLGNVVGFNGCGGLIGDFNTGSIRNCYSSSNVRGNQSGGLLGTVYSLDIENCYSSGDISGVNASGLIVQTYTKLNLKNCYSISNITGTGNYCGGIVGMCSITNDSYIENVYSYGDINFKKCSGGLIGRLVNKSSTLNINNANIYSKINFGSQSLNANFIAINENTDNEATFGTLVIKNSRAIQAQNVNVNVKSYKLVGSGFQEIDYDLSDALLGLTTMNYSALDKSLQIGIDSSQNSSIQFNSAINFKDLNLLNTLLYVGVASEDFLELIDKLNFEVSDKQTHIGSYINRLESSLDEISTQYENLLSSRSTIQDADIAEVSADYIRQQILQQASATLMSTVNQSPSIALQLI